MTEEKNERKENTTGTCFICGIDRTVFDRAANSGDGFKEHITEDHHMWNYLYFMFYIWEQDKDDDDGLEYYVRYCLPPYASSIDWIPSNKALRLDQKATEEEALGAELADKLKDSKKKLQTRVSKIEANIGVVLEQLTQTIKKDHIGEENDDKVGGAVMRPITSNANGLPSAPSSAWNIHRKKSPPYERPGESLPPIPLLSLWR
jgi:hypothetical protein